ncbi:MAG: histidine kinase [Bacteroidales bacterium]|nr:histidine kinase [Bacteroidales bacterium]
MIKRNNTLPFLSMKNILLLSLAISVGFHLLFSLSAFFGNTLFYSEPKPMPAGKFNFLRVLTFTAYSFFMVFCVFLYNRRLLQVNFKKNYIRLIWIILGSLLITGAFSLLITFIPIWLDYVEPKPGFMPRMIRDGLVKDFLLTAIVILIVQLLKTLHERNQIAVENESLRAENITTHYEALKSQMDPHFMFNSLNTLQSLINVDAEKAKGYVQELSQVLRSTLQNKEVVTLEQELQGVQAYCNLMQIRYGENLHFDFRINPKYNDYQMLPLSVQGLVENAIKHNVISGKQPLEVSIMTTEEGLLKVSNPVQPKIMEEPGNGIGLANLTERYRLKWDKNVEIVNDGRVFMVTLPLVEPQS